ncbi:MAG: hypothetical protein H9535_10470 [Ignavibacteria bacterium]|nr:hypothetical protein [Ignavibacteria bacterium]MBL7990237.1 hypothetical protein [Candidatus Kapabacteria bacterium]
MQTLTLHLSDTLVKRLARQAELEHTSIEEIALRSLEALSEVNSAKQERSVEEGIEYVIAKNRELLQRLA